MEKSIGAFWIQNNDKGEYWRGYVELEDGKKENVIVFKNNYKKDKQPDLRMFKQKAKEGTTQKDEIQQEDALPF